MTYPMPDEAERLLAAQVDDVLRPKFKLVGRARWLDGNPNPPVLYVFKSQYGQIIRVSKRFINALTLGAEG